MALKEKAMIWQARFFDESNIGDKITRLVELPSGWAKGMQSPTDSIVDYGKIFNNDDLNWLAKHVIQHKVPKMNLSPTPEGGVQMEWKIGPYALELEIDLVYRTGEWAQDNMVTDDCVEENLDLSQPTHWEWLVNELARLEREIA